MSKTNFAKTIQKLQNAINSKLPPESKICINKHQLYSEAYSTLITITIIEQYAINAKTGHLRKVTLFKSPSNIQICMYLRDMWYEINDWDLPMDNEQWNEARKQIPKYN